MKNVLFFGRFLGRSFCLFFPLVNNSYSYLLILDDALYSILFCRHPYDWVLGELTHLLRTHERLTGKCKWLIHWVFYLSFPLQPPENSKFSMLPRPILFSFLREESFRKLNSCDILQAHRPHKALSPHVCSCVSYILLVQRQGIICFCMFVLKYPWQTLWCGLIQTLPFYSSGSSTGIICEVSEVKGA